jgi:hypothetical protein
VCLFRWCLIRRLSPGIGFEAKGASDYLTEISFELSSSTLESDYWLSKLYFARHAWYQR